ncbi:MAG TPA: PIN domain-containing protein [Fimbriimonadaceae bacterium]
MKQALIDTDMLSYVFDRRYPEVNEKALQYLRVFRCFSISVVTLAESIKGIVNNSRSPQTLADFMAKADTFETFDVQRAEAILAGNIMGALLKNGQPIGPNDPFIAATAMENERVLITNNIKHYQRIVDLGFPLELENWREQ